jgi:hypothetical protein
MGPACQLPVPVVLAGHTGCFFLEIKKAGFEARRGRGFLGLAFPEK